MLPNKRSGHMSSMPWRARGSVVSAANGPIGFPSCAAPHSYAAPLPHRAPPRLDPLVVCPGFAFGRYGVQGLKTIRMSIRTRQNTAACNCFAQGWPEGMYSTTVLAFKSCLSCPKPEPTTGGTERGGAQQRGGRHRLGAVGRGRAPPGAMGWRRVDAPRTTAGRCAEEKTVHLALQAPKTTVLDVSPQARTKKILCKPDRRTKRAVGEQLATSWFISGARNALRSWPLTNEPTPLCPCKPFTRKACPGNQLYTYVHLIHVLCMHFLVCNTFASFSNDRFVL